MFARMNSSWADSPLEMARRSSRRLGALGAALLHLLPGRRPRLDGLGEAYLVVLREQLEAPDIGQVEADEVFVVPFNSFLGHFHPSY
jgi:hypothetical protein